MPCLRSFTLRITGDLAKKWGVSRVRNWTSVLNQMTCIDSLAERLANKLVFKRIEQPAARIGNTTYYLWVVASCKTWSQRRQNVIDMGFLPPQPFMDKPLRGWLRQSIKALGGRERGKIMK